MRPAHLAVAALGSLALAGCAETIFHPPEEIRWAAVAAGDAHTCALDEEGLAWCWGSNSDGQLGVVRRHERQLSPVAVNGRLRFRSISVGARHSCALDMDGRGWCWGANGSGQLGEGTTTPRDAPRPVLPGPLRFATISAGGEHNCGITTTGEVHCWGSNRSGQLGSPGSTAVLPRLVPGVAGARAISAGARHGCASDAARALCWGANDRLQVGPGPADLSRPPTRVPDVLPAELSAGRARTCAIASGAVVCWGDDAPLHPIDLAAADPERIAAGGELSCAAAEGDVWCWAEDHPEPRRVSGLGGSVTSLDVGEAHACAIVEARVRCWGRGSEGQLGHGRRGDSELPVP